MLFRSATLDQDNDKLTIKGIVASLDGKTIYQCDRQGTSMDAKKLGQKLGKDILKMGADKILKEIYQQSDPNS